MSDNIKNIIERTVKTFFEAFISTLLVGIGAFNYSDISDKKKILTLIVLPALAAAISAAWNYLQTKFPHDEQEAQDAEVIGAVWTYLPTEFPEDEPEAQDEDF